MTPAIVVGGWLADLLLPGNPTVQDGDGEGAYFQRFDDRVVPKARETLVDTHNHGQVKDDSDELRPRNDGGFMVVWEDRFRVTSDGPLGSTVRCCGPLALKFQ